jgi:hypothetical protein
MNQLLKVALEAHCNLERCMGLKEIKADISVTSTL